MKPLRIYFILASIVCSVAATSFATKAQTAAVTVPAAHPATLSASDLKKFTNYVEHVVSSSDAKALFQVAASKDAGVRDVQGLVYAKLKVAEYPADVIATYKAQIDEIIKAGQDLALAEQAIAWGKDVKNNVASHHPGIRSEDVKRKSAVKGFVKSVSLWAGAKIDNPYTISVNTNSHTGSIQNRDSSTDGYLELRLNNTFVARDVVNDSADGWSAFGGNFTKMWKDLPDLRSTVGYVFRNSSAPTNFDGSTIVGSSDIYAEGALGIPIWRMHGTDTSDKFRLQSTIEIAGGFGTDKDHLLIHPTMFIGGGMQSLFQLANNDGFWCGRIGMARIDRPRFISGTSSVAVDVLNEPEFKAEWVPSLGFDIKLPVNSTLSAQFGGNVYLSDSPASWNVNVGLAVDLAQFFKAFMGSDNSKNDNSN